MIFFNLFNQVFELNVRQVVKPAAFKLYIYWLYKFNKAHWPALLYQRANQVYTELGMDKNTFVTAVAQLEARGLLAYEAGKNGKAGEWLLNYKSATESWAAEVKNSPQSKVKNSPREDDSEVNFSPSFYPNEAETFDSKVKNSLPIRNRQNVTEDKTKKMVGEAAEEITLAPLPAKKFQLVPPFAEPPHAGQTGPVAAAELSVAPADEAKTLANELAALWDFSELSNQPKWGRLHSFTRRMAVLGRLSEVRRQLAGYRVGHLRPGVRPHRLDRFLGEPVDDYAQGEWCSCNWSSVAAKAQARPAGFGQPSAPPPHADINLNQAATAQREVIY